MIVARLVVELMPLFQFNMDHSQLMYCVRRQLPPLPFRQRPTLDQYPQHGHLKGAHTVLHQDCEPYGPVLQ